MAGKELISIVEDPCLQQGKQVVPKKLLKVKNLQEAPAASISCQHSIKDSEIVTLSPLARAQSR